MNPLSVRSSSSRSNRKDKRPTPRPQQRRTMMMTIARWWIRLTKNGSTNNKKNSNSNATGRGSGKERMVSIATAKNNRQQQQQQQQARIADAFFGQQRPQLDDADDRTEVTTPGSGRSTLSTLIETSAFFFGAEEEEEKKNARTEPPTAAAAAVVVAGSPKGATTDEGAGVKKKDPAALQEAEGQVKLLEISSSSSVPTPLTGRFGSTSVSARACIYISMCTKRHKHPSTAGERRREEPNFSFHFACTEFHSLLLPFFATHSHHTLPC
jgi:hypothetical protein